jgi:hypothetical protein
MIKEVPMVDRSLTAIGRKFAKEGNGWQVRYVHQERPALSTTEAQLMACVRDEDWAGVCRWLSVNPDQAIAKFTLEDLTRALVSTETPLPTVNLNDGTNYAIMPEGWEHEHQLAYEGMTHYDLLVILQQAAQSPDAYQDAIRYAYGEVANEGETLDTMFLEIAIRRFVEYKKDVLSRMEASDA